MTPELLEFLKWALGGLAAGLFFLQLLTGQPLDFLTEVFGPDRKELKRLRKENAELRRQITGAATEMKALPESSETAQLRSRIENLEALATGDLAPKVER